MAEILEINAFDFDGVISIGITPGQNDVIITGRTIQESEHVYGILRKRGINNPVFFNPISYSKRGDHTVASRIYSGEHKSQTIGNLRSGGVNIINFFEDDELQAEIIKKKNMNVNVIMIISDLVEK